MLWLFSQCHCYTMFFLSSKKSLEISQIRLWTLSRYSLFAENYSSWLWWSQFYILQMFLLQPASGHKLNLLYNLYENVFAKMSFMPLSAIHCAWWQIAYISPTICKSWTINIIMFWVGFFHHYNFNISISIMHAVSASRCSPTEDTAYVTCGS